MRRFVFSILIAASLLLSVPGVFAQGRVTGNVAGHVTDPSGAAVPGAKITVTNTDTGVVYSSVTDKAGYYLVRYLPIGTYDVAATQEGFKRLVHMGVLLDAGSTPTVDFKLTLGATAQSVTVSAAGALVEAQTADRGNVVDTVRLENFPAQTGNVFGLTFNTAGVQPTSSQKSYTFDDNSNASSISINGGQMSANGGFGGSNLTLYDGVYDRTNYGNHQGSGSVVGVIPSAQSVQQLKVVTSPYSAEYGSTTGGAIIAITKSGTNKFHGGGWYNQRDTALSATRFERTSPASPSCPSNSGTAAVISADRSRRTKLSSTLKCRAYFRTRRQPISARCQRRLSGMATFLRRITTTMAHPHCSRSTIPLRWRTIRGRAITLASLSLATSSRPK